MRNEVFWAAQVGKKVLKAPLDIICGVCNGIDDFLCHAGAIDVQRLHLREVPCDGTCHWSWRLGIHLCKRLFASKDGRVLIAIVDVSVRQSGICVKQGLDKHFKMRQAGKCQSKIISNYKSSRANYFLFHSSWVYWYKLGLDV